MTSKPEEKHVQNKKLLYPYKFGLTQKRDFYHQNLSFCTNSFLVFLGGLA